MMDAVVITSVVAVLAFVVAWALRPDLRAWIERPKYRFQCDVEQFDAVNGRGRK